MDNRALIRVLSLFIFIAAVHCQDQPEITKVILPEIKRAGETGRLNCTITRQGSNKAHWIHKKSQTTLSTDDVIDLEEKFNPITDGFPKFDVIKTEYPQLSDLTTYTLIIRRLQLTDAGQYICQVQITGSSDIENPTKEGSMVVMLPPNIIHSDTTQTQTIQEGEDVLLTCRAEGFPTPKIKWVRTNGMSLPIPGGPYSYLGEILNMPNMQKEDRGVYRCIADNDVRPVASYDSTIYIQFRPYARPVQDSYGQAQNRMFDITIECRIAGDPAPDLQWYKVVGEGLDPIKDDERHLVHTLISYGQELSISEFWFQLTIINVQANDYGDYECEGTNTLGSHSARVKLYETSECQGPNCPPEDGPASGVAVVTATVLPVLMCVTFVIIS